MANGFGSPPFVDESPKESAEEIVWRKKGPALQKEVERLAKENARLANGHAKTKANPPNDASPELEWPAPDMELVNADYSRPPPFDNSVFPPTLLHWAERTAADCSAPIDYVAADLIGVASGALGNVRRVSPWPGWVEHPFLWIALVGLPSAGKTPTEKPFKGALLKIEHGVLSGHGDAMRRWAGQQEEADARLKTWQAEVKTAVKQNKAPPEKPREAEPPPKPAPPRLVIADATTEEAENLLAKNRRGLILMRSELAGWIGQLDRYGGSGADRAFYLESWDGNPHTVDRVKHNGQPVQIPFCSLAIVGGLQPVRLRAVLSGPDDGLAERFAYVWPDPVSPKRPDPSGAKERAALLVHILRRLRSLDWDRDDNANPVPKVIPVDDAALHILDAMRDETHKASQRTFNILAGWRGKTPGRLLRLALTLEYLEWAAGDDPIPPEIVSITAMQRAADYLDYLDAMMCRCLSQLAVPIEDKLTAQTARLILGEKITSIAERDLYQKPGFHPLRNPEIRERVAQILEAAGWLQRQMSRAKTDTYRGGRPSPAWIINPQLSVEP